MFALALEILTSEDRNVLKHFALALGRLTVHLSRLNVVKIMLLKSMTAKALGSWSNCATVGTCVLVAPIYIQSIFARFPYFSLILFKFFL